MDFYLVARSRPLTGGPISLGCLLISKALIISIQQSIILFYV